MTYQLGLIGYPIQHSLSPWIHGEFLDKANLQGNYKIMEIDINDSFAEKIEQIKNEGIMGFNVTVPYKQTIIPFLDELDDTAKQIGAVNTVVHQEGKWIGYNTDGIGYVRALEHAYPELFQNKSKKKVLILGAGGAARGIYHAVLTSGYMQIDIANRTKESAEKIALLNKNKAKTSILTLVEAEQRLANYDLIIQTTSVGMKPNTDQTIISLENVNPAAVVSDIVYQPIKTSFLQEAEQRGASIHFGHTMLLYQAQFAFEIWTKENVSTDQMDEELKKILEGR
ncbi:shikimate dehydrogenase [Ornithinibacillus sp. 4-3]|uniref:Shikimate dehydrogenase (NADP(+)) n=1 Tax=Ornithinibacillus sp. 4-3 TaxID=3231488 RepID=A0AB39HLK6_9BACI